MRTYDGKCKQLTYIVGFTKHPFFAENWRENQGCFNSKISAIIYWNQQVGTWSEISSWSKKGFVGKYIGIVKLYLQGYSFKFWLCGEMATNLVDVRLLPDGKMSASRPSIQAMNKSILTVVILNDIWNFFWFCLLQNILASDDANQDSPYLRVMSSNLKNLLSLWFSVGFLNLERMTWQSPCDMLQKVNWFESIVIMQPL